VAKFLLQIPLLGTRAASSIASRAPREPGDRLHGQLKHGERCNSGLPHDIHQDLLSLSQLTSNALDSHSTFIFLPQEILSRIRGTRSNSDQLVLAAQHSLSDQTLNTCTLSANHGLIGWTATHKEMIHVSPFEQRSSTLGIYRKEQSLKSFAACPIYIEGERYQVEDQVGVLACDSKKAYAFSDVQLKLLQDFALQISRALRPHMASESHFRRRFAWEDFCDKAEVLWKQHHPTNLSAIRIKLKTDSLARFLGQNPHQVFSAHERLYEMISLCLPEDSPALQLPNGGVCLLFSNSKSANFLRKIERIMEEHLNSEHRAAYIVDRRPLVCDRFQEQSLRAALLFQLSTFDSTSDFREQTTRQKTRWA